MHNFLPDGRPLILASKSPARRELLARLRLPFYIEPADIEEIILPNEAAPAFVRRLAELKARTVARKHPAALVIGADQVAVIDGEIIGKPGNHEQATDQLRHASGQKVTFYTGLCLFDSNSTKVQVLVESFLIVFRALTSSMIESYLSREQPYHCAGSFKSEGLGIALLERLEGDDPSSLIGLPLIHLSRMLESAGVAIL
jgi:septum formation protein